MDAKCLIGQGIYTMTDVARIVHVDPRSIRRWASGYMRDNVPYEPVLQSEVVRLDGSEFVVFAQLVEFLFINLFREHGTSIRVIRAAARNAARRFESRYPFASAGLTTDGKAVFLLSPGDVSSNDEQVAPADRRGSCPCADGVR